MPPEAKEATPVDKPRRSSFLTRVPPPSDTIIGSIPPFKRPDPSSGENEFGVHADDGQSATKSHSVDAAKKNLERVDSTHSTGNHVAALRHRYTRTVSAFCGTALSHSRLVFKVDIPSQVPKDIPRLPMSVSEIASRYQPFDEPRTASPVVERFPPDTPMRTSPRDLAIDEIEIRRRRQRIEELTELELKEKEYELRQRERDLDQRTRDFERDRRHFLSSRPDPTTAADGPKGPRTSPFQHKRGSQSVTHVNLPSSTNSSGGLSTTAARPSTSHSPSRSPVLPPKDHAPFCGCDACSVSKYKTSDAAPSPRNLRPPEPPILLRPEKPKGWIRRLSMPSVNVAFSLDAKKNASALSLKAGLPLPAENGRLRKRSFEQGISNRSVARR
ncbi:hypothetical protein JVU11DRAFT_4072 [Chiua virens]|nr:hypothetical protein JVU11DRAFT_4072 [Chiua virens]